MSLGQNNLTIIAIDPGYDRVGWAVGQPTSQQPQVLGYGCIQTSPSQPLWQRYLQINDDLEKIVTHFHPNQGAIESLFFAKNQSTAIHVAEARGVILSCLLRNKVECHEYTPLQIKQVVTGYGKADKVAVAKMVQLQLKLPELSSSSKKVLDDTLDALGLLITHAAAAPWRKHINHIQ